MHAGFHGANAGVRQESGRSDSIQGDFELSDLTQIQTESYDRFLQLDKRPDGRKNQGLEEILREVFPDRKLRRAVPAGVRPLRAGKAALHADRMPSVATDVRSAVPRLAASGQRAARRGRSLPGRHADHDRWWRVHHQRCRARRRQPVAPFAGRRLRADRSSQARPQELIPAASFPSAAAGSNCSSARRTLWAFGSTRAASSPP